MTQTTSLAAAQARIIKLEARLKAADELAVALETWEGDGHMFTIGHLHSISSATVAYRATGEQP